MINGIDFSMSYPVQVSFAACVIFPFVLMILARLPKLAGRNALQFLLSFSMVTAGWAYVLITVYQTSMVADVEPFWVSFFLYSGITLVYLEIWGLLSRGYTLGLLLTFYKANKPLSAKELAGLYRGGEGLDWLIKHRFSGLLSAKMIKLQNNNVVLTARGVFIAVMYKFSVWVFGLRYTG